MTLEDFVKEKYPNVLEEHKHFVRSFVPSISSELVSLVDGLAGHLGQPLEVIGYRVLGCGMDVFMELKNITNDKICMCPIKKWDKMVKLIHGDYSSINSIQFIDE
ncbi:MAG: hypothetical protein RR642_02175 [Solibacillus sp.]